MQFHVVPVAQGNGVLVARLPAHCPWLGKGKMMGFRCLTADQAWLSPDVLEIGF